jgi:hypothetical protein
VTEAQAIVSVLLASLGFVVVLATAFVILSRHHLRLARRRHRSLDQLAQITSARRRMLAYPLPPRWAVVRSTNTACLREFLGLDPVPLTPWSEALARSREPELFVSPPVEGWTLLIGGDLPDPVADVDATYCFLLRLSREFGEVQFYSVDRVLNFHAWARYREGRVDRAYAWASETLWNEGRMTLDERLLGCRCRAYGSEPEELPYGEVSPEQTNAERVPLLARRWGPDFATASEILLQQEGVESGGDEADRA